MKKVYVSKNPADAHLVKGILELEGIDAVVQGEFLWGVRGEVPITSDTCPSVWVVDDADYEKAEEIIMEYRRNTISDKPTEVEWKCTGCGEYNEEQFTECWKCGKSRPI